jgi:hypothetical protein
MLGEPARNPVLAYWRGEPGPAPPLEPIKRPPEISLRPLPKVVRLLAGSLFCAFLGAILAGIMAVPVNAVYVLFGGGTPMAPERLMVHWGLVGGCVAGAMRLLGECCWSLSEAYYSSALATKRRREGRLSPPVHEGADMMRGIRNPKTEGNPKSEG